MERGERDPRPGRALAADRLVRRVLLDDMRRRRRRDRRRTTPSRRAAAAAIGNSASTPVSRTSSSIRPLIAPHASSSQTQMAIRPANHSQCSSCSLDGRRADGTKPVLPQRCRAHRIAGIHQRRHRVEQLVVRAGGSVDGAAERIAAATSGVPASPREAPRVDGGDERVAIRLAREPRGRTARSVGPRRAAAAARRRRGAAPSPRDRAARRHARDRSSSSGPRSATAASRSASSDSPAKCLASAADSARAGAARGIERQIGRALEERRGRGLAPAGLRARGRKLELICDASSGPAAARARCHARRSGSASASVASAIAACAPADRLVKQRGRRRRGRADGGTGPGRRTRTGPPRPPARRPPAPTPCSSAARHTSVGLSEWLGGRDEQQSPRLLGQRREPAAEALLDPVGRRRDRARPESRQLGGAQATGQLDQRERVAARLGHDAVDHLVVNLNRTAERRTARASPLRRPATSSSGSCRNASPLPRTANTSPNRSACRRRATNASVSAEA